MIDIIKRTFSYLVNEREYTERVESITNIFKKIIYEKREIKIVFLCEIMEKSFELEIWRQSGNKNYLICESAEMRKLFNPNYQIPDLVYESIFQYVDDFNEDTFYKKKEAIFKERYFMGKKNKIFVRLIDCYKELIDSSIKNIESKFLQ